MIASKLKKCHNTAMILDPFDPSTGFDDFLAAASKAPDLPRKVCRQLDRVANGITVDCGLDVTAFGPGAHALLVQDSQNRLWAVFYHLAIKDGRRLVSPLAIAIYK